MGSTSAPEPILTHTPWHRQRRFARLRRGLLVLALVLAGVLGVLAALRWYDRTVLARHIDHLYENVLAEGDVKAAWRQADPRFQAFYPLPVFQELARRRPGLFARDKLRCLAVHWLTSNGQLYVEVQAQVAGDSGEQEVRYYCSRSDPGGFRLVGIAPDLLAAVPRDLKAFSSQPDGDRRFGKPRGRG